MKTRVFRIIKRSLHVVVPLALLAASGYSAKLLAGQRKTPKKAPAKTSTATLVNVVTLTPRSERVLIQAYGKVQAAESVVLSPEVSARVQAMHPGLIVGGRINAGEMVVQLDPTDYELIVKERTAQVERARFELALEHGRALVASREWELLGGHRAGKQGKALALRKPQLRNAKAQLSGARNTRKRAALNVARTTVVAPFNAVVTRENVGPGQLVGPASQLATLVSTDVFHVHVQVPLKSLAELEVPGAKARVRIDLGDRAPAVRMGRVVRVLGDVAPVGRMAQVVVAVDDPLALMPQNADKMLLLMGVTVGVEIDGPMLDGVFRVPRVALRDDHKVWVMTAQGTLAIVPVALAWRWRDDVLVSGGLKAGDRVVTTRLRAAISGMKLRLPDQKVAAQVDDLAETEVAP